MSAYRWEVDVREWDTYGDRVISTTPVVVVAATRSEVTEKVRAAFEATFDSFRKFWSHDWALKAVNEVEATTTTTPPTSTTTEGHDHG